MVTTVSGVYFDEIYITSAVGTCDIKSIKDVTENILARIDENIEHFEAAKKYSEVILEGVREIVNLENKIKDFEQQLKIEKAKNWWDKLKESLRGR